MSEPREPSSHKMPDAKVIEGIYSEVLQHNRENTGVRAAIATTLSGMIEHGSTLDDDPDQEAVNTLSMDQTVNPAVEQRLSESEVVGDLVMWSSDGPMKDVGLRIDALGKHNPNKSVYGQELTPHVDSPQRFVSFLETLTPDDVSEGTSLRRLATDILNLSVEMVRLTYAQETRGMLAPMSDEEIQTVGDNQLQTFAIVAAQYERLGLGDTAEFARMDEYARRWGEGVLPEYIFAEYRAYLHPDIQGYGPASWQKDVTPTGFEDRWDEAVKFVLGMKQDPTKANFAEEVRISLLASIQEAKVWMVEKLEQGTDKEYMERLRTKFDDTIAWAEVRLAALATTESQEDR
jgi:hypothetical protein